jgi:hypothetical protein
MNTGAEETAETRDPHALDRAWKTHEAEIRAVELPSTRTSASTRRTATPSPNADVVRLAGHVIAVAERLLGYVGEIREKAPGLPFDHEKLDRLASVARAAIWASTEVTSATTRRRPVLPLIVQAAALREKLEPALRAKLAAKERPRTRAVPKLRGRKPADWGVLLQSLVLVLTEEGLDGTPLTTADLDTAARLALELLKSTRPRGEVSKELAEARVLRVKALFLLRKRYDEVRAVVVYAFRDEPRMVGLVPTLWSARGAGVGRRKKNWVVVESGAAG